MKDPLQKKKAREKEKQQTQAYIDNSGYAFFLFFDSTEMG